MTPTAGNATIAKCGNLAALQEGGTSKGSTSLALPLSDDIWLAVAKDLLMMELADLC